jgi:uncharacterized membrane protein
VTLYPDDDGSRAPVAKGPIPSKTFEQQSDTARLEAFSDGVFAVAITLLVLNLRVPSRGVDVAVKSRPSADVLGYLATQWPSYLAYVASFLAILVMWINHHTLFKLIGRADRVLMIYNGLLLMLVTVVPFSTSLLAEYVTSNDFNQREVAAVYSGVFILVSIAFNLLWRYAARERRLLDDSAHPAHVKGVTDSYRFGPLFYVAALLLALVNIPASLVLNIVLAIYFALPHTRKG